MKTYNVTIRAVVTKTYEVEAEDEGTAELVAHEIFVVQNEADIDEDYSQETMNVEVTA
jgi:hypothetical protein